MNAPPGTRRNEIIDALEQLAQNGVPSAGSARLFDIGSEDFLRYFETEILADLVNRGGATCKFFEGPYGSGKTHLLQLFQYSALEKGMAVVRADLSQSLRLEDWNQIAQHILQHIQVETKAGIATSFPKVLEAIARERQLNLARLDPASLPHQGFARAVSLLCTPRLGTDARELISRFLQGERIGVASLRAVNAAGIKHPLSYRNAELFVRTALTVLYRLGVPGTLLLFDEAEQTFTFRRSRPPLRIIRGANLLRRLIDATASGRLVATAAVFAVLPGFVEQCALAYPALGQRLELPRVEFGDNRSNRVAWRSPVLPLHSVAREVTPERFLEEFIDRASKLVEEAGGSLRESHSSLSAAGLAVLEKNASSGYRRPLIKQIATMALTHV